VVAEPRKEDIAEEGEDWVEPHRTAEKALVAVIREAYVKGCRPPRSTIRSRRRAVRRK
jgi:hypothetical protein